MPSLGHLHAALAFEVERLGDDADGEDFLLFRDARDDRGSARARAAAHAGRDEAHVRAVQDLLDLVRAFLGGFHADFRIGAGAEAGCLADAKLDLGRGFRARQSLRVGVRHDEFDALQVGVDHVVDRVAAGSADADHHYPGPEFNSHGQPQYAPQPRALARLVHSMKIAAFG